MPASVQAGTGQLPITQSFSVAVTGSQDALLDGEVQRFEEQLSRQTGIPFRAKAGATPTLQIHAEKGREAVQKLGEDESYELTVADSGAKLTAPTTLGVLRGLQTFLQLVQITPSGFAAPAVTIKDQPRFPWRGLLIDVSRHFIPIEVLKRNLDGMAAVKMNVLHWHLSDDQGFRVESKRFSKLTGMGSDGLFYTQAEIRDLIAYAHDRGIRVMPEFDIPGHSRSWVIGYPELASGPGPYTLEDGDPKNNQDLQAYFNQRLEKIVAKNHKTMVGWDEILHPNLPKTIVVHSWRGQASLAAAAKQGYRGLLSFGYYLDLMWPAARHDAVDPMADAAATLTPEEKGLILGGEACQWAEWVTPENIDSHIWPRNAVIAERLWSPQEVKDVPSMYARMNAVSLELEWLGLTHRSARMHMLHRMAGPADITALRVLADVVEPVKDYDRWSDAKGPIDFHAPLNRIIDAVYPESDTARQFSDLVQTFVKSDYKDQAAKTQLRTWLATWRDNDARLHPLLSQTYLLQEDVPLSQDLSALGAAGLQALDYLDRGQTAPDVWKTQQLALIEQARKPMADVLLMVVAPVQQLVEASAAQHT